MAIRPFMAGPTAGYGAHVSEVQKEGATQTFKKGAPLVVSSGYLIEASADPTEIFGIAEEDGENASAGVKSTRFMRPTPGNTFEGTFSNGGTAVALAQTDLGVDYGITKDDTTGFWYVDKAKTTTSARVTIVGFRDAVGATDARVFFVFHNDQLAYST